MYPKVTIFIITHLCKCSINKLRITKEWKIVKCSKSKCSSIEIEHGHLVNVI